VTQPEGDHQAGPEVFFQGILDEVKKDLIPIKPITSESTAHVGRGKLHFDPGFFLLEDWVQAIEHILDAFLDGKCGSFEVCGLLLSD
jgi:hypothetical protein